MKIKNEIEMTKAQLLSKLHKTFVKMYYDNFQRVLYEEIEVHYPNRKITKYTIAESIIEIKTVSELKEVKSMNLVFKKMDKPILK